MSSPVRCGVVGVGYLGRFHAEKYSFLPESELVAVCDVDLERAKEIGENLQCQAFSKAEELLPLVDAVSIAVPTAYHYSVAKLFLAQGVHVLLEKPMTATVAQAEELIDIAQEKGAILQIGHLERFNPAIIAARDVLNNPRYIESHRLAIFKPRGTDVTVMLDLMIHDIDIIQTLVSAPIREIHANGAEILSEQTDIATARILFENACVANVVASRVSFNNERKMRIFQHDAYVFLDLHLKKMSIHHKGTGEMFPGVPNIEKSEQIFEGGDVLLDEIQAFVQAILHGAPPVVSGEDGKRALATAMEITRLVHNQYEIAAQIGY